MLKATTVLRGSSSVGLYGAFAIEIKVGATSLPDLETSEIRIAASHACDLVEAAVMEAVIRANPDAMAEAKKEREDLIGLFGNDQIHVEEIPNGYCSIWCCKHLPWLIVTTKYGKFGIGWRKRVISLQWTGVTDAKGAEDLFPKDNVTKSGKSIHAWGLDDARRYIETIIASAGEVA